MPTPILATKIFIPSPRAGAVCRPHLIERLNQGLSRKLTLVSAPAGFGKTTLVCEWVADCERPVAWLSLDEGDNDPTRFLAYLVAALQTLAPRIGEGVLAALDSAQTPPIESMLTALLNEIAALRDDILLVVDDYHTLDATTVDHALTFLIEHLPPQLHLVVASREDPALPLARYRARGQLIEVRAAELRFSPEEAAEFLNRSMGLNLSTDEVNALEARTEGWIAGLQMAALSMQGLTETSGFVQAFTGSHRFVLDFLVEEVLQRQHQDVRNFLLQTSILDRLNGPLCDAVTGEEESQAMLESLERDNLFVVPLDDQRLWYRYHHLFADVLQMRAVKDPPTAISILHTRASAWYEQQGLPMDAIRHALAGEDFEHAADLIELQARAMRSDTLETTWSGWVEMLPDELVRARPVLGVYYSFSLLAGSLDAADEHLRDAERWLDRLAATDTETEGLPAGMIVNDQVEFVSLSATISIARAYRAGAMGDVPETAYHARRALELLPDDDFFWRGAAYALLGLADWASADLSAADGALVESMATMRRSDDLSSELSAAFILADLRLMQGRLRAAESTSVHALSLAAERGGPVLQGMAEQHIVLCEVCLEQNDLAAAQEHLAMNQALAEQAALVEAQHRWYVAMAHIKEAQGDLNGTLDLLDEADRQNVGNPAPDVHPISAQRARVLIANGRLTEALSWADARGLTAEDEPDYLREFEQITLAKALLAKYRHDGTNRSIQGALDLLSRLLPAAEAGERLGSMIEILVVQALALHALGETAAAIAPLTRAMALAEPEGYVRIFVSEGAPMVQLLAEVAADEDAPDYASELLAAFDTKHQQGNVPLNSPPAPSLLASPLIELLSDRELEVLQLVAQGLSNREISEQLYLALSTVKGHNRNIYGKLQVQRRTEAVARARELGLV